MEHRTAMDHYSTVLMAAIAIAVCFPQLAMLVSPKSAEVAPVAPLVAALAAGFVALLMALRRIGPLTVSRPVLAWVLPSTIDRRGLVLPSLILVGAVTAALGAGLAVVGVGHLAARPTPAPAWVFAALSGAAGATGLVWVATRCQQRRRWARGTDLAIATLGPIILVSPLVSSYPGGRELARAVRWLGPWGWATLLPPDQLRLGSIGAGAAIVLFALLTLRAARRISDPALISAAQRSGTLIDAAVAMEPAFVLDEAQRAAWSDKRLRSRRPVGRLSTALIQYDLLALVRQPRRLAALVLLLLVPPVAWQFGLATGLLAVGVGALAATLPVAGALGADLANPSLLRLLGIDVKRALTMHSAAPAAVAAIWSAAALGLLQLTDALPAGPWWALGLGLGPAAAASAVRRAKQQVIRHDMIPLDSPMGAVPPGLARYLSSRIDLQVIFSVPAGLALGLVNAHPGWQLTWQLVLIQAAWGLCGLWLILTMPVGD